MKPGPAAFAALGALTLALSGTCGAQPAPAPGGAVPNCSKAVNKALPACVHDKGINLQPPPALDPEIRRTPPPTGDPIANPHIGAAGAQKNAPRQAD